MVIKTIMKLCRTVASPSTQVFVQELVQMNNKENTPSHHSGLAGPWNRGIIAHQTPHFRRPPKHVNNKGPLVFAQTFCTAWFISLEKLHIYSNTYVFSNTFEGFRPKCTFRGCFSKYRRTFIVYMFRRPPEVWSLMSDNALISGTGKVGMGLSTQWAGNTDSHSMWRHHMCPSMATFAGYLLFNVSIQILYWQNVFSDLWVIHYIDT